MTKLQFGQEITRAMPSQAAHGPIKAEWTKVPPTVPGWYWANNTRYKPSEVYPVLVSGIKHGLPYDSQELGLGVWVDGGFFELEVFEYWLGPIPQPEPPPID